VTFGYDNLLRPKSFVSNEGTPELNVTLTRDVVGNILTKEGTTYTYDGMSRMTNEGTDAYSFDELSNIIARGTKKYSYEEGNTVRKNQMRLASFYSGTTYAYTYDDAGNPTAITNKFSSLTYDEFSRLRQLVRSGVTDKYWYNQAGLRFKREEDSTGANTETIYTMYSGNLILFQERYNDAGVWQEARLNLILGGQIVGHVRKVTGQAEVYQFFGLDHLGSRRVVWNADGTKQVKFSYDAWGGEDAQRRHFE
jgi:hypothetical protein